MRIMTMGGGLLVSTLRRMGHEVMAMSQLPSAGHPLDRSVEFFADPLAAKDRIAEAAASFLPDWILLIDDSTPLMHLGLERIAVPKAWYAVDTHLHAEWHRLHASLFDVVFCAQRNQAAGLRSRRGPSVWLPLWSSHVNDFLPWEGRTHDVAFVGNADPARNPARVALLGAVRRLGVEVYAATGDWSAVYPRARIVLNQSVRDDLNFRVFEAMGCGALLVTDRISHSLEEIGEPGRDFLVYEPGDADDLAAKIRWALSRPGEAEAMARRGRERVAAGHRDIHRAESLLKVLEEAGAAMTATGPGTEILPVAEVLGRLAAAHELASRLDLPVPLARFFAGEARRLAEEALAGSGDSPWASLALARLDLDKGHHADALERLRSAPRGAAEPEYRRGYLFLRALLLAHAGRIPEARQAAMCGLREFPCDADLERLSRVLDR